MNILGGVHQAPLYCKLIPTELLPLIAVTAELVGDDGRLCCSPASTEGPGGSLRVLMATTYSYVVIPCKRKRQLRNHIYMSERDEVHDFTFRIRII